MQNSAAMSPPSARANRDVFYVDDPVRACVIRRAVKGIYAGIVPVAVIHNLIHERAVYCADAVL